MTFSMNIPLSAVHFSKVLSKRLRDTSYLQLSSKPSISVVSIYSRSVEASVSNRVRR